MTTKNKKFSYIFLILLLFFLFSSISTFAAPLPFTTSTTQSIGYDLRILQIDTLPQGVNHTFNVHVFNQTSGYPINSGISCYFYLNSQTGKRIAKISSNAVEPTETLNYPFFVNGNNFSNLGFYSLNIQCNDTIQGGAISEALIVTNNGLADSSSLNIIPLLYILLIAGYGLLIFGFARGDETIMTIASFLLMVAGIIVLVNGIDNIKDWTTDAFGIVTIAISSYVLIRNAIDQVGLLQ